MRVLLACNTSEENVAQALQVSSRTLRKDAKFKELHRTARLSAKAGVVGQLLKKAMGGDLGAICFWLKTQFPEEFSEKQKIEIDQKLQAKYLSYEPLPLDEWMKEFGAAAPMVPTTRTTDSVN